MITRRPVHEAINVEMEWIEGDPPDQDNNHYLSYQHDVIAAKLRGRPGAWARLAQLPSGLANAINAGRITSYRPSGSFEAVQRRKVIYVRYVGGRSDEPEVDS